MAKHLPLVTLSILLLMPFFSLAETAYIIDKIEVGIHSEAKLSSPIVKIVSTGAALEVQQRGVDMSKVKDQEGTVGWVNTAYLMEQAPRQANSNNNQKIQALEAELNQAETEIKQLKTDLSNISTIQETKELKSMKLKVAELEAKLSQQKKSTKTTNSANSSNELNALEQKNQELEKIISNLKNQTDASRPTTQTPFNYSSVTLWIILISILIGAVLGILLFDFYNRRQHGGFRI